MAEWQQRRGEESAFMTRLWWMQLGEEKLDGNFTALIRASSLRNCYSERFRKPPAASFAPFNEHCTLEYGACLDSTFNQIILVTYTPNWIDLRVRGAFNPTRGQVRSTLENHSRLNIYFWGLLNTVLAPWPRFCSLNSFKSYATYSHLQCSPSRAQILLRPFIFRYTNIISPVTHSHIQTQIWQGCTPWRRW